MVFHQIPIHVEGRIREISKTTDPQTETNPMIFDPMSSIGFGGQDLLPHHHLLLAGHLPQRDDCAESAEIDFPRPNPTEKI